MTKRTRERFERLENRVTAEEAINSAARKICQDGFSSTEARLSALEDSLQAAEAQIAERKAENIYLNRLLDMLQHGARARGELLVIKSSAEETPK